MHTISLRDSLHNGPQCDAIIQGAMCLQPSAMPSDQALKFRAAAEIGKPDGLNQGQCVDKEPLFQGSPTHAMPYKLKEKHCKIKADPVVRCHQHCGQL